MAKHVIILGAGASASAGAPLMATFLDVAKDLWVSGKLDKKQEAHFSRVFESISLLQAVHSKADIDLVNIESIFTAFEMAKTLKRFPGRDEGQIEELIESLKWVIVTTLERSMLFPVTDGSISAPPQYNSLALELRKAGVQNPQSRTAILTFNYDIALDVALCTNGIGVDYGFTKQPGFSQILPVLKLHGSLNWTSDINTGEIVPYFVDLLTPLDAPTRATKPAQIMVPVGSLLESFADRHKATRELRSVPVIVPPSWNKADSHRSVADVWSRAAVELAEAESIYVVGYSLPSTDSFFKLLYALGTIGNETLRRFWVFNPDETREPIFKSMLGPGARSRFRFSPTEFGSAIHHISQAIFS